jgi:hypothetical protein
LDAEGLQTQWYRYLVRQGNGHRTYSDPCLLNEKDPVFQMGQDKMKPRIAFETSFEVVVPLCEHWLSTWPTLLHFGGLMWYPDGSRRLAFSFGIHATAFQVEMSAILACVTDY